MNGSRPLTAVHFRCPYLQAKGFTLLELSIVLVLIGIILGTGLTTFLASQQAAQVNNTVARMDTIEKTLLLYSNTNGRIPCPADLAQAVGSVNYGVEAANAGSCTGGTPASTRVAAAGTAEGGIPTRTLRLSDDYMYDGWGHKFRYAVDPYYTTSAGGAFPPPKACSLTPTPNPAAITVRDATGASRTTTAAYAIISHGQNAHGAYGNTGGIISAGSVNTDEQMNCHCDSTATATTYTPIYVEKYLLNDYANAQDNFDDIVTFKDSWQMQMPGSQIVAATNCPQYLYIADTGNNRVLKYNTSGQCLLQFSGSFNQPETIAVDASQNIWVADLGNSRVQEYNSSGTLIGTMTGSGYGYSYGNVAQPYGITIAQDGNSLWVSDTNNESVTEFTNTGTYVANSGIGSVGTGNYQFHNPFQLTIDLNGNYWIPDNANNRLMEYSFNGSTWTYIQTVGQFGADNSHQYNAGALYLQLPSNIAVDTGGNLWVTDTGSIYNTNNRVVELSSTGIYINGIYGTGSYASGAVGDMGDPWGIVIDSSGNKWITDAYLNRVTEYSGAGPVASAFTSTDVWFDNTQTGNCGGGKLSLPHGIAIGTK